MSNRKINPSQVNSSKIKAEILGKIGVYENRMSTRLSRWVEAAELYCGKTSTTGGNSKASSNSPELFKAIRALRNMLLRMLLGAKPSFELECMDIIGYNNPGQVLKVEHYVTNQLDLSRYEKGMARAIDQVLLYGSVACHEQFEPQRSSFLGRKQYVTSFRPISLINCAFSLDAYDIEESNWVALSDIQGKYILEKLLAHDPDGEIYDLGEIHKALSQSSYSPKVNAWVTQRMAWQGYVGQDFTGGIERTTYYGPLDCLNDHEEYSVEIVNREFIIRMESYDGIRPVRVAVINSLDVEPLGNGLYDLFGPLLAKIDTAEHALLNMITLAGASMFSKQKSLTDEDSEFVIRQFGIMSLENPLLNSIGPDARNIQAVAGYTEANTQRFRQASGATDTLQALVSSDQATATSVSLAMNEAVRAISVQAQILAPVLHRDHIKVVIQNAQKYIRQAQVIHINGAPITVVPSDLMIDVDVRVKTPTDQDFRPAKLQRLREGIQLTSMFPPGSIPGKKMNPGPMVEEYCKMLDVPRFTEVVQDLTEADMINMSVLSQMQNPTTAQSTEGGAETGEERVNNGKPGKREQRELNRNMSDDTMTTPVGKVAAVPGDQQETTRAIRASSVGGK